MKTIIISLILAGLFTACSKSAPEPAKKAKKTVAIPGREVLIQEIFLHQTSYVDKEVTLVGKMRLKEGQPQGSFTLVQYVAGCCPSHDAREIAIQVVWSETGKLPFNSWLKVKGKVKKGDKEPQLAGVTVTPIRKPSQSKVKDVAHL